MAGNANLEEKLSWYALKVFCNRLTAINDELRRRGVETYVPMSVVSRVDSAGKRVEREVPLVNSLMFVHATSAGIIEIANALGGRISVYRDLSEQRRPSPIPDSEMQVFRLVADSRQDGLQYLGDDPERYLVGEPVKVIGGLFAGAEGHICRIKGNRRLVVAISGVCAVATAYIPRCFLQSVSK